MDRRGCLLLLGAVLFASPAWCQLPFPVEEPTHPPPTRPPAPKPQLPQSTINFDFNGFFKYFIEAFGKDALKELLRMTDTRLKVEFPNAPPPVITPVGPPAIPCSTAPYISGSSIVYSDPLVRAHGSTATYKCSTGYKGNDVVVQCQSGAWTAPAANVSCTIVMCNNPPTVDNAVVRVSDYTFGSQASYTCKPGFHASDIAHPIKCRENGQWDPPQFTCANMMANNHAMSAAMSSFGGTMPGMQGLMSGMGGMGSGGTGGMPGMTGLPAGMEGLMANVAANFMQSQMQQSAGQGSMGGAQLPPHLMGNSMMGGITGGEQAALPAHLQGMAPLAPFMDPSIMGSMGMGFPGMAGPGGAAAGPPRKPMEPEQMQEMQTLMMMGSMMNAQRQQQMRQQQMMQEQMRQQQLLQQRQQQQQQQQQQQKPASDTPGINIGALLTQQQQQQQQPQQQPATATDPGAQMQMLQTALQQMQALANQLKGLQSGTGSTTSSQPAATGTQTGGSPAGSPAQPTSVFGGSGSSGSSSSTGSSSPGSSPTDSSNPIMSAIMQSALAG